VSFPLVFINVFLMFALATAVACWGFALIPIWRAKMRTMTSVPLIFGLIAAGYGLSKGETVVSALVCFAVATFLASMLLAFVYGWTKKNQFEADDVAAGIGRFGPVMVVWTCSLLFMAVVALVNATATGSAIPFHNALGVPN
jgi:hypothetical protein